MIDKNRNFSFAKKQKRRQETKPYHSVILILGLLCWLAVLILSASGIRFYEQVVKKRNIQIANELFSEIYLSQLDKSV